METYPASAFCVPLQTQAAHFLSHLIFLLLHSEQLCTILLRAICGLRRFAPAPAPPCPPAPPAEPAPPGPPSIPSSCISSSSSSSIPAGETTRLSPPDGSPPKSPNSGWDDGRSPSKREPSGGGRSPLGPSREYPDWFNEGCARECRCDEAACPGPRGGGPPREGVVLAELPYDLGEDEGAEPGPAGGIVYGGII